VADGNFSSEELDFIEQRWEDAVNFMLTYGPQVLQG
jgi:hypothetical protein